MRSFQTVLTGIGGSIVVTLTGFITTPILLRYLGAQRFGIFRTASDWFGYIGLLEFGVGGALLAVFSKALGTDHRAGVAAGVRAGVQAYLLIGLLMLASAVLLRSAMPELVRAPEELAGEVRAGCSVYLIGCILIPLVVFRPLAEAEQRGYVVQLINTAQLLTAMGVSVGLAAAGWGLVGQFLGVVAGSVVFHLSLLWDGLRRHPEVIRGPTADLPALWGLSWPNLLFNLSGRLSLFTDNILLAAFLGPSSVTSFVLTQRLILAAGAQATGIGAAGWAGLIDLHYRGEVDLFALRLIQLTRLTGVVGAALLIPIAVWNRDLIVLWVGPDQYAGPAVTWLSAVNAWGLAVLSLWGWLFSASGRVRMLLPTQFVGVVVNLGASAAGTAAFGLPGPLLGTTIVFAGLSWWWLLILLHREFGVSRSKLFWAAIRPALIAVAYGFALILLADAVPAYDLRWSRGAKWAALIGWLAGAAGAYLILAWSFALPVADKTEWVGRLREWHSRWTVTPVDSERN